MFSLGQGAPFQLSAGSVKGSADPDARGYGCLEEASVKGLQSNFTGLRKIEPGAPPKDCIKWMTELEMGEKGLWKVSEACRAAKLLNSETLKTEKDNQARMAELRNKVQTCQGRMKQLEARLEQIEHREKAIEEASDKAVRICDALAAVEIGKGRDGLSLRERASNARLQSLKKISKAAKEYFEGHVHHWIHENRIPLEIHEEQYEHVLSTVRFVTGHIAKDEPLFLNHQERMRDSTIVFHSVPKELSGLLYILKPYEGPHAFCQSSLHLGAPAYLYILIESCPVAPQWLSQGFRKLDGMLLEGLNAKTSSVISFQIYKSNSPMSGQILLGENSYGKSTTTERFIVALSFPLAGVGQPSAPQHTDYNQEKAAAAAKPVESLLSSQSEDSSDMAENCLPKSDAELMVESWYSSELAEKEYGRFRQRHDIELIEKASSNLFSLSRPSYLRRTGRHTSEDDSSGEDEMFMTGVYIRRFIAAATFIQIYEDLNRDECSLAKVPAISLANDLKEMTENFQQRAADIAKEQEVTLDKIFAEFCPQFLSSRNE
ncbi:hypothetical protein GUITHDRAFT_109425 [Guillardia theta CCMP2712]|uniref:Uncharacterized protein n=2 Tax=Guillardia theta TaxID=55529 RepID=L1J7Y5_GUITC|nr:hypothetical protein GUITHDRAFT_109425 [Guillardia theta CCMP2712]EKX44648.1 hypothetical protein GUITHDRAFT_109425 [Guillardia theta CCMP2712]|eukprot:XP_005831628.1 hypothetical protein GUITHDRAFT_109425 [Guillardia theta CCMP2712]